MPTRKSHSKKHIARILVERLERRFRMIQDNRFENPDKSNNFFKRNVFNEKLNIITKNLFI